MRKLNWKHIIANFLGIWFCAHGFQILFYLRNVKLSELIRHSTDVEKDLRSHQYFTVIDITDLAVATGFGFIIGVLFAFTLAILISVKRDWFWLNSLLAFFLFLIFNYLHLLRWEFLKKFLFVPGSWTTGTLYYLINGLFLVMIGVLALLLKKPVAPNNLQLSQSASIQ